MPINVRKKARKWRGPEVLFPQCQIWIVSTNKRDDTTQQIKPLNISLPTSEKPWPPTIASKKMRAAINHALSWPENFHRRGFLRFFCCLGETWLRHTCANIEVLHGVQIVDETLQIDPIHQTNATEHLNQQTNSSMMAQRSPAFLKTEIPHHLPIFFKTKLFLPSNC